MQVDYIVVGLGLAGIAFCEQLEKHNKSFVVFDTGSNVSSTVAGGVYNPVILKRFTASWDALKQIETALPFYENLEIKLKVKLDYKSPVCRIFASVEEQNLWFEASDRPVLSHFLIPKVKYPGNAQINAPFGIGEVAHSGRIDTALLIETYKNYLAEKSQIIESNFDYGSLEIGTHLNYKSISAKNIIFSEGFGLKRNSWFNHLPLTGNKGELLTIKAPALKLEGIVKASVFIIPLGKDLFRVGATYNPKDKDTNPTPEARKELTEKLNKILNCPYEIVEHEAGVRPTVNDRKPLVGVHSQFENLFVLNGLGSRGVMIAPSVARDLYNFIEKKIPLDKEIDINRFL
jgi:glycine oxidase